MPDDFPNGRGGTSGAAPGENQTGNEGGSGTGAGQAGGGGSGAVTDPDGAGGSGGSGVGIGEDDEDEPATGAPEEPDAGPPADAGDAGGGAP
jgi:hypothetical protein